MARDISKFTQILSPPSQWLEAVDPRLSAIGDHVEAGRIDQAADVAEEVIAEGYLDIRPISVLLYAVFLVDGVEALPSIIEAATLAIRENFEAIGPKEKKQLLFDKRLGWLFDRISDQLEYHDKSRTDQFVAWTSEVAPEEIELALASASTLAMTLARQNYNAAPRAAGRLTTWLRGRAEVTTVEFFPPNASASQPEPPPAKSIAPKAPKEEDGRHVTLAVSHRFSELCQKLQAFETLLAKGRAEKAAIVAADIQQLITQFDPRMYFPELFSEFAALMSDNVNTISAHMDQRDSPAWNALDQFYRVDLKAFVER